MGGSRCSYRNCTVKSDGSTHMFHYPVFDRVRCHNWLVKAQRLDFLNLKVSQLINRRVCQHHFENKMFMNYKKDKLTHTAVPTLDGPFVQGVPTSQNPNEYASDIDYLCSIKTDDIESEISDKKAIFSEKYGNFLANCDLLELNENLHDKTSRSENLNKITYPIIAEMETQNNISSNGSVLIGDKTSIEQKPENIRRVTRSSRKVPESPPKKKKVQILSEETIIEPITINSKLIPVCPDHVLNPPKTGKIKIYSSMDNKNQVHSGITSVTKNHQENTGAVHTHTLATLTPARKKEFIEIELPPCKLNEEPIQLTDLQQNPSVTVGKGNNVVRSTDIEKKRRFNMRLRDAVEQTFNKLEVSEAQPDNNKIITNVNENSRPRNTKSTKESVSSQLSEGPEDLAKHIMGFMDCRMKQMENMLLLRIDNNTKHITALRNTIESKKTAEVKAFIKQPRQDDTSYKRGLFDEISQFLSAEAKSMIYEEMFLNAFKPETEEIAEALRQTRKRKSK